MHKYFKHYKIYKDKMQNGYSTYRHEKVGEFWGYITQLTEQVANGVDIQDGYIMEYGLQVNNYYLEVNDIITLEEIKYKVTASTMIKGKCFARVVREWQNQ